MKRLRLRPAAEDTERFPVLAADHGETVPGWTGASQTGLPARDPAPRPRHAAPRDDGQWDRTPGTARRVISALRGDPPPRPRIHPLPPELPRTEHPPVAQVVAMLKTVRYPGCFGTPEDYAATMRVWSRLTGTASAQESPGAWARPAIEPPAASAAEPLPALPDFPVMEQRTANLLPGGVVL